jgi:hypothetical protein
MPTAFVVLLPRLYSRECVTYGILVKNMIVNTMRMGLGEVLAETHLCVGKDDRLHRVT